LTASLCHANCDVLYEYQIAWGKLINILNQYGNKEGYMKLKIIISTVIIYECDMQFSITRKAK